MPTCSELRRRESRRFPVLRQLRRAARRRRRRATSGRSSACCSPTWSASRAAAEQLDPEDVRATLVPVLRAAPQGDRAARRHGREVHRRRRDGALRRAGRPRGRPGAGRARGARDPRRDRELNESDRGSSCRCGSRVDTGEALIALGARPSEGEGMASGDVVNTAARLQSAAPVDGVLVSRGDLPRDEAHDRLPRGGAGHGEGQERADRRSGRRSPPARASGSTSSRSRARRSSAASARSASSPRRSSAAAASSSRSWSRSAGVPGIGKSRLVSELFQLVDRDDGADPLAAGPVAALRRGPHATGRSARS